MNIKLTDAKATNRLGHYVRVAKLTARLQKTKAGVEEVVFETAWPNGGYGPGIAIVREDAERLVRELQALLSPPPEDTSDASVALVNAIYPNAADWHTGGGCHAIGIPINDKGSHFLITDEGGFTIPNMADQWMLGCYNDDGDTVWVEDGGQKVVTGTREEIMAILSDEFANTGGSHV